MYLVNIDEEDVQTDKVDIEFARDEILYIEGLINVLEEPMKIIVLKK